MNLNKEILLSRTSSSQGFVLREKHLNFTSVLCGKIACLKLKMENLGLADCNVVVTVPPRPPFNVIHTNVLVRARHLRQLMVHLKPTKPGVHKQTFILTADNQRTTEVLLTGVAISDIP